MFHIVSISGSKSQDPLRCNTDKQIKHDISRYYTISIRSLNNFIVELLHNKKTIAWWEMSSIQKWRQGYQTHLYIYGDHPFIGDRAQGYSQW